MLDAYLGRDARLVEHRSDRVIERGALVASALAQAAVLRENAVGAGARVVLAHSESAAFLADLLAIWQVGAVAVVVSHGITAGERLNVLQATVAAAWIGPSPPEGVPALAPATFDTGPADAVPPADAGLDQPAVIMMTSGTTSTPKGVVLTHRALQARIALNRDHIGDADLAVSLTVLPLHFGHGLIGNTLTPLAAGATVVLWPEPGAAGLPGFGAAIDRHGVTFLSSVPSLWRVATRLSPKPSRETLKRVHVGSAPLAAPLWQEIIDWTGTRRVLNMYGITETANWIGGHSAEDGPLEDNRVGRPWGGVFRIVEPDGSLAPTGRGEVAVNSPSLMSGYLDLPEQTAAALGGGFFRTGDIGTLEADGRLVLNGRSKFEINKGGIKIPAEEVDALLERHPAVLEACAFALPDALSGETVAAAIVLKEGEDADAHAIRQWCESRIRRDAWPSRLFLLPTLPRSDRGKLNRDRVRALCLGEETA